MNTPPPAESHLFESVSVGAFDAHERYKIDKMHGSSMSDNDASK